MSNKQRKIIFPNDLVILRGNDIDTTFVVDTIHDDYITIMSHNQYIMVSRDRVIKLPTVLPPRR